MVVTNLKIKTTNTMP